jgi:hypothetical protein
MNNQEKNKLEKVKKKDTTKEKIRRGREKRES